MHVMTRVLIVDDHPSFRASARAMLEAEGFDVVGEADDGPSALAATRELRPDVILLDVQLRDTTGFELCDYLCGDGAGIRVVLVSSREASDYGDLVETSPAKGFISKGELTGDAIRELIG
jgi:DNA-binding NarL/FixJ family response regulator